MKYFIYTNDNCSLAYMQTKGYKFNLPTSKYQKLALDMSIIQVHMRRPSVNFLINVEL